MVLELSRTASAGTGAIQDRIRWYWSYPKNVNIRVEHKDELRFPTVTICNENRISRKTADARGIVFMVAVCNRADHYIFILFLLFF